MKLRYLHCFPLLSLKDRNLRRYFSIKIIIKAFVGASLLANSIFLSYFDSNLVQIISPFITLAGLVLIFTLPKYGYFWSGFFTGILWFYWIGFSFFYYSFVWAMPFAWIGIGAIYGVIFRLAAFASFMPLRAIVLMVFSYIHPFGFNWFNLEATLVLGIFEPSIRGLVAIFASAIILASKNLSLKFRIALTVFALCFGIQFKFYQANYLPFKVKIEQTNISQSIKWQKDFQNEIINDVINRIILAKNEGAKLIILPEAALPLYLSNSTALNLALKELSHDIAIIVGSLRLEDKKSYNSAFLFNKGKVDVADKLILVPFGEEVPLPEFAKNYINDIFYAGANDLAKANKASNFDINGELARIAICYEATKDELYKDSPKIMIAISNNAWFKLPNIASSEPILQRLLLKYYSNKYQTTIYHSANASKSEIIAPKKPLFKFLQF